MNAFIDKMNMADSDWISGDVFTDAEENPIPSVLEWRTSHYTRNLYLQVWQIWPDGVLQHHLDSYKGAFYRADSFIADFIRTQEMAWALDWGFASGIKVSKIPSWRNKLESQYELALDEFPASNDLFLYEGEGVLIYRPDRSAATASRWFPTTQLKGNSINRWEVFQQHFAAARACPTFLKIVNLFDARGEDFTSRGDGKMDTGTVRFFAMTAAAGQINATPKQN